LAGVTAAVVGVVLNLGIWFGVHTVFSRVTPTRYWIAELPIPDPASFSPASAAIAIAAGIALFRFKAGLLWVLAGGALAGLVLRMTGVA
jgi:chromate transporter